MFAPQLEVIMFAPVVSRHPAVKILLMLIGLLLHCSCNRIGMCNHRIIVVNMLAHLFCCSSMTKNFTARSVLTVIFGGIRLAGLSLLFCKSCYICASKLIYRFQIFAGMRSSSFQAKSPTTRRFV
jgi:hypothetical protein